MRTLWLAILGLTAVQLSVAEITVHGRVVNENGVPVPNAHVTVGGATAAREMRTDPDGAFTLTFPEPVNALFTVEHEGYYALKDRTIRIEGPQELTLVLNTVREVFQSADVHAEVSPVDVSQELNQEHLSGTEVNDMPYANSHSLRNSMQLMPGVVEDATGALHIAGSEEHQVQYLLNGFDVSNPITGQFQPLLAVEGIRSMDLSTGLPSAQYGKGTAGVLAINTEAGTDEFHYTATDFIPGLSIQQGLRLGNWYPRFGVSGPIVRGHAWFADTFESEYNQTLVTGLPSGQNTRSGWAGSNLLHGQVNLNPSNILFADFLLNIDNEGRVGLAPLNPVSTTLNVHSRDYTGSLKDQVYFGHGLLVDFGYAHQQFSQNQKPQGESLYILAPQGNSGDYFVNSTLSASRDQALVHAYLPKFQLSGSHQLEAGIDADWLNYDADNRRTGYEVVGLSGQLLSETVFPSPAIFQVHDFEMASYLLDTWRASKHLQVNLGLREDWDQRVPDLAWSPRLSAAWSPFHSERTRVSAGYAVTHDVVTLDVLGRPLDQTALTTTFQADGAPSGPAVPSVFSMGTAALKLPRAGNWTASVDHQISTHVLLSAKYLRRRGTDGFAFVNVLSPVAPSSLLPLPGGDSPGNYQLTNLRRDDYDSLQVSVRQTFSGQFEWSGSYTWSRALSNGVLDNNTAQPLQVLPALVAMPWDVPHRFVGWAYVPLPWKDWALTALADARSGFPFSVRDQTGIVVGAFDSYRYPIHLDFNLALERMVTFHGYRFALRGGVDNLTGQANPTAVNNVVGAPQFLQFLGDEGRHFVVRIRFFGRAGKK